MDTCDLLQKQRILKICGLAACILLGVSTTVAQTPSKAPKYQKITVVNHGGFVIDAKPSWKCKDGNSGSFGASSKFPVGESKKWDMSGASGITTGCEMWVGIGVVWGKDMTTKTIEYAPNGHTITFEIKGTTLNPWAEVL